MRDNAHRVHIGARGTWIGTDEDVRVLNANTTDSRRYVAFAVTQGVVTALGSRVGSLLR